MTMDDARTELGMSTEDWDAEYEAEDIGDDLSRVLKGLSIIFSVENSSTITAEADVINAGDSTHGGYNAIQLRHLHRLGWTESNGIFSKSV